MAAMTRTRKRIGRAPGGGRKTVARTHTRTTPKLGTPGGASTKRVATVKTKGGLKRTAKVTKTTTGSGAGRVAVARRVITRVKNGRTIKRVVTRVNRGGQVTVTKTAPRVSGKGPQSTRPKAALPPRAAKAPRNGGTVAPRPARKFRR